MPAFPSRRPLTRFLAATALAAAATLSLSLVASANTMHGAGPAGMPPIFGHPGHEHGHGPLPPFLRGIELSEAQEDRVFAILHAQMPKMREHAKAARQAHDKLHALTRAGAFDEGAARTLAEAGARAAMEMALLRAQGERQIMALLTPQQRAALDSASDRCDKEQ